MQELKEFGLSENEIIVYMTLLKTGSCTANRVSTLSGMKRGTTYDVLSSLSHKGLVSSATKDDVKIFSPADPTKIIYLLDEKRSRLEKIIPKLNKLKGVSSKFSGVSCFEGRKGVKTVLNDIFDSGSKELFYLGSRKMAKIPLKYYPDNFVQKRIDKGISVKGVLANEDKVDPFLSYKKVQETSTFTFSKNLNGASASVFLYEDKVSFISNSIDPVGVIIENKEIASLMKLLTSWVNTKNN